MEHLNVTNHSESPSLLPTDIKAVACCFMC